MAAGGLEGLTVLVTGSWSGIGRGVAERFAAERANVVIHALESTETSRSVAADLGALHVEGDITNPADVDRMMAGVTGELGGLDVLVNNAATTHFVPHSDIESVTLDIWHDILNVNLLGTWLMCQRALPALRQRPGSAIINISALAGSTCTGSSIPYSVSKAAVNQLTKLLARVVGPAVRVNAIAPGFVETGWTEHLDEIRSRVSATAPLGRPATPRDVGDVAVALASAKYVTGQVVTVDGGISLISVTS
jgi:ketoreductase RED2